ncbi:MAG: hypothetical protein IKW60_02735 [Clostridia bacterium]|nr:hypothetical protein [Clostridia bacterium]
MNQKNYNCPQAAAACGQNTETTEAQAVLQDAREECCEARVRRSTDFSDAVCINTSQIYDSCRDRDCVTDGRVYLTREGQELLDRAINVKIKSAEIIWVFTDVEPLSFNRGYFSVDLKFFICTTLEIFTGVSNPTIVRGLTTYDKRVILYGSEGTTKSFSSKFNNVCGTIAESWHKTNMPTVTVEVVDPVALTAKIAEGPCSGYGCNNGCNCDCDCDCDCGCGTTFANGLFPDAISGCFDDDLVVDDCERKVLVTYGLFFLVRLERDSQLLVEAEDFCIPKQECSSATEESPCSLFNNIRFPIDEFFPPQKKKNDGCGCNK